MRHYLRSKNEVFHFFANDVQESGQAGNVFFSNGILYSYGYHFKIAEKRTTESGVKYVLITQRKYSNTTAKHVSATYRACQHLDVILVPNLDRIWDFYKDSHKKLTELLERFSRARKSKPYFMSEISDLLTNVEKYAAYTGNEIPDEYRGFFSQVRLNAESMADDCAKASARLKKLESERIEKLLKGWMNFEDGFTAGKLRGEFSWVRFDSERNRFETTQGVVIGLTEGHEFYERLKQGLIQRGEKLSYYTVLSESENTIKIGCHKMKVKHLLEVGEKAFGK